MPHERRPGQIRRAHLRSIRESLCRPHPVSLTNGNQNRPEKPRVLVRDCDSGLKQVGAGSKPAPTAVTTTEVAYALPAAFNPLNTFSGLSGNLLMRTPVALKMALAMAAMGGTQAISPAPLAP